MEREGIEAADQSLETPVLFSSQEAGTTAQVVSGRSPATVRGTKPARAERVEHDDADVARKAPLEHHRPGLQRVAGPRETERGAEAPVRHDDHRLVLVDPPGHLLRDLERLVHLADEKENLARLGRDRAREVE